MPLIAFTLTVLVTQAKVGDSELSRIDTIEIAQVRYTELPEQDSNGVLSGLQEEAKPSESEARVDARDRVDSTDQSLGSTSSSQRPPDVVIVSPSRNETPTGSYADLICSYSWPCNEALSVVYGNWHCPNGESGGNPAAYNSGNYGLFQINAVHSAKVGGQLDKLFDPAVNVAVAYIIWSDQGWGPWACRP